MKDISYHAISSYCTHSISFHANIKKLGNGYRPNRQTRPIKKDPYHVISSPLIPGISKSPSTFHTMISFAQKEERRPNPHPHRPVGKLSIKMVSIVLVIARVEICHEIMSIFKRPVSPNVHPTSWKKFFMPDSNDDVICPAVCVRPCT
jgi:hypothetical protein